MQKADYIKVKNNKCEWWESGGEGTCPGRNFPFALAELVQAE